MHRSFSLASRFNATLITSAIALTITLPSSASAAGSCPIDQVTEAGTCAPLVPMDPLTDRQKRQAAESAKQRQLAYQQITSGARGTGILFPASFRLAEVDQMRIFREGEGNGKKSYTCGPSATRNVVAAMYKRRYGTYKDFGEATFARWQSTTTRGTSRANVARSLNTHFKQFGSWSTWRPADKRGYEAAVTVSTSVMGRSVIANLQTGPLPYFHTVDLAHFNFVYGYVTTSDGMKLMTAEEWDPKFILGYLPRKYQGKNPYGRHAVKLADAFTAISNVSYHGIVM